MNKIVKTVMVLVAGLALTTGTAVAAPHHGGRGHAPVHHRCPPPRHNVHRHCPPPRPVVVHHTTCVAPVAAVVGGVIGGLVGALVR